MGHVALIRLSWPQRALWQNTRPHWRTRSEKTRAYRTEAWGAALAQSIGRLQTTTPRLIFSFHPPDNRRRDIHNLPATMKPVIDGIADAMGCDDAGFRCVFPTAFGEPTKGGCVIVEISE